MGITERAPSARHLLDEGRLLHSGLALLRATKEGDIGLVKVMLEALDTEEVNIATAEGKQSALHIAARRGHCEIAGMLLASPRFLGTNALDDNENTALHIAALEGKAL